MTNYLTKIYILIISVLGIVSCKSDKEANTTKSIKINIENASTLKMSNFYELEDVTYFSDSLIVDHLKKISRVDDFLVLHCSWTLDYLVIKNMKSGEEFTISNKGEGPEQYKKINDFFINSDDKIEVLDGKSGKILTYNLRGELLSIYQNELLQKAQNFISLNDDDYFLFGGNFYAGSFDHQLVVFNKSSDSIIEKYIPIDHDRAGFMSFIEARNFNKNPAYFSQTYNPYIYKIEGSSIVDSLLFDFGSYNIPEEDLNKQYGDVREFSMTMQKSGNVYGFSNVIRNRDVLFASGNLNGKILHFYADLNQNAIQVYDKIENDLFGLQEIEKIEYYHRPLMIDEKYAYFSINLERQNEKLNGNNQGIADQSELNAELLKRINNFEEGDNLAIVKLKIIN